MREGKQVKYAKNRYATIFYFVPRSPKITYFVLEDYWGGFSDIQKVHLQ